jgi:hypothetical protein
MAASRTIAYRLQASISHTEIKLNQQLLLPPSSKGRCVIIFVKAEAGLSR